MYQGSGMLKKEISAWNPHIPSSIGALGVSPYPAASARSDITSVEVSLLPKE